MPFSLPRPGEAQTTAILGQTDKRGQPEVHRDQQLPALSLETALVEHVDSTRCPRLGRLRYKPLAKKPITTEQWPLNQDPEWRQFGFKSRERGDMNSRSGSVRAQAREKARGTDPATG